MWNLVNPKSGYLRLFMVFLTIFVSLLTTLCLNQHTKQVPSVPALLGACNAAGPGMGGIAFIRTNKDSAVPILWSQPFSDSAQYKLVLFSNLTWTINNSDLELYGNIAYHDIVAQFADKPELTIGTLSDSIANVYWLQKRSTTTAGPPAYILCLQIHHQWSHRCFSFHNYIPGSANDMADTCLLAWHLTYFQLFAYFNINFLQKLPWRLCQLSRLMNTALIFALFSTL